MCVKHELKMIIKKYKRIVFVLIDFIRSANESTHDKLFIFISIIL